LKNLKEKREKKKGKVKEANAVKKEKSKKK
jgi:hypothetical protein